ncbi:MAG: DUF6327 family protein [Brumimicrobium sp.]|nr:DUF6327 family protein [Brumimicrobium sp.]
MQNKRYSTYSEIDKDLQILKLERDIHYQKILLNVERMKDNISPVGLIKNIFSDKGSGKGTTIASLISTFLPYLINRFKK